MRALIKVETAIMRDLINLLAFRVYLPEFMKEVNQTVERGESPRLLAKLTERRDKFFFTWYFSLQMSSSLSGISYPFILLLLLINVPRRNLRMLARCSLE